MVSLVGGAGKVFQPIPVLGDQGFLFCAGPVLDLEFGGEGLLAGLEFLGPDQFDRAAFVGVAADGAGLVLGDPAIEIVGVAGAVAAVGAVEDVGVEGHGIGLAGSRFARNSPSTSLGRSGEEVRRK